MAKVQKQSVVEVTAASLLKKMSKVNDTRVAVKMAKDALLDSGPDTTASESCRCTLLALACADFLYAARVFTARLEMAVEGKVAMESEDEPA